MVKKEPSLKTKRFVYNQWKEKCAFCGEASSVDIHHIIPIKDDPNLIDNPDNLILLCPNHHRLTQKTKDTDDPVISFKDIEELKKSKYAKSEKHGFYFDIPQRYEVSLGSNKCICTRYILIVNDRPIIELWPQKPAYYSNNIRYFLIMRFFDEQDNFIGGMFANYWASVRNHEWKIINDADKLEAKHLVSNIFIRFEKKDCLVITGIFYSHGLKIVAKEDYLILPGNNLFRNCVSLNNEIAFFVKGDSSFAAITF